MADIGAQLREARTRARIEIAQMEAQSKIRAKYLRALENEEWDLLPGPTYVKSFLRTYGDMLDLDGRSLVADYKREHEPFLDDDIGPTPKHTGGRMASKKNQGPPLGRLVLIALVIAAAIGGGYWFATRDTEPSTPSSAVTATTGAADAATATTGAQATAQPATVTLTAKQSVFICARAGDRQLINGRTYQAGQKTSALRGRTVALTLTNTNVELRVNGKQVAIPAGGAPVNLTVTADGVTRAAAADTACKR